MALAAVASALELEVAKPDKDFARLVRGRRQAWWLSAPPCEQVLPWRAVTGGTPLGLNPRAVDVAVEAAREVGGAEGEPGDVQANA
jgi:hypothetical protein